MVCNILRKVWTDVKGHRRKVLKCMDPPKPKRKRRKGTTKKKRALPRKPHKKITRAPKPHKKIIPTFEDAPLQEIVPFRQIKTRAARKFASTNF